MREIKFRAWDKVENRWMVDGRSEMNIYDFAFKPGMNWTFIAEGEALERVVFMQFIGLHDKNGKEIYEGDVARNRDGEIGEVKFHNACYKFYTVNDFFYMSEYNTVLEMEVIGNIYENKELLTS